MTGSRRQLFQGLRVRLAALFVIGLILTALAFDVLLVVIARRWFEHELEFRGRSLVTRVAKQVQTPLLIGDQVGLREEEKRAGAESDVVAITIYGEKGRHVSELVADPRLWEPASWRAGPRVGPDSVSHTVHRTAGTVLHAFEVAIVRGSGRGGLARDDAAEALGDGGHDAVGEPDPRPEPPQTIGWVRIVVANARLEASLGAAGRIAMLLIVLAVLIGVIGTTLLMRIVVQPLREASDLARGIAAGHLERRLPVQSDDELGALAHSMNTMAIALDAAQRRERAEAAALRNTAEAVVAVAQTALTSHDPLGLFRVVAAQVRRVADCQGIALALADETHALRFRAFDPEPNWAGLEGGMLLDDEIAVRFDGQSAPLIRLALLSPTDALSARLARGGYRSALLVPLSLAVGPPAVLLLASRKADGFSPAESRVVAGLASHLSAALRAAQLRDRLEQAFSKLEVTQDQLVRSEKLRATGELASGVAHDFNNVLGAILGRVQLLRRRARERRLSTPQLLEALAVMELAARDGAETVRRLRQFSLGEEDAGATAVDLAGALEAAADFTKPRWKDEAESEGRRIELTIDCEPGLRVVARGSELREVFTNLILNAVDALPRGGSVRLSTRRGPTGADGAGHAIAVVEDDGVGMTAETQKRVFDPFFTTKGARGTGLGMSVVYGIVERLGGTLGIRSELDRGTAVELSLPLAATAQAPESPEVSADLAHEADPGDSLDILVVDDEKAVRDLVAEIAETLGHRTVRFESAREALAAYEPGRYQLVLSDLGMPGMTGWDLAKGIRAIDTSVTIAFVTGWGQEIDPAAVRASGADVVIGKPFTIEDISRVVGIARRLGDRAA